ncbi:unnamed protein product [Diamesa serratosioi]
MDNRIKYMDLPTPSRSTSPSVMSSKSNSQDSNLGFFQVLCKRLGPRHLNRSVEDLYYNEDFSSDASELSNYRSTAKEHNNRSQDCSSNESDDSNYNNCVKFGVVKSGLECVGLGLNDVECNETRRKKYLSTFARFFHSLTNKSSATKTSKSLSSTPIKTNKSNKKKKYVKTPPPQQRILRRPIEYTYVKGMSGLATTRIPRNSCCHHSR